MSPKICVNDLCVEGWTWGGVSLIYRGVITHTLSHPAQCDWWRDDPQLKVVTSAPERSAQCTELRPTRAPCPASPSTSETSGWRCPAGTRPTPSSGSARKRWGVTSRTNRTTEASSLWRRPASSCAGARARACWTRMTPSRMCWMIMTLSSSVMSVCVHTCRKQVLTFVVRNCARCLRLFFCEMNVCVFSYRRRYHVFWLHPMWAWGLSPVSSHCSVCSCRTDG